jgi:hypothetical protein
MVPGPCSKVEDTQLPTWGHSIEKCKDVFPNSSQTPKEAVDGAKVSQVLLEQSRVHIRTIHHLRIRRIESSLRNKQSHGPKYEDRLKWAMYD